MTAPTKAHRLAVARAWIGLSDMIPPSFHGWIEGEPGGYPVYRESFERLAQLVADAEGAWIPCEERMPEPCTGVLFATTGGTVQFGYRQGDDEPTAYDWSSASGATTYRNNIVTHWRPSFAPSRFRDQLPPSERKGEG